MKKQHLPVLAVFVAFFVCVSLTFCGVAAISMLQPTKQAVAVAQAAPVQQAAPVEQLIAPTPQNQQVSHTAPKPTATHIPPTPESTATHIPTNTPTPEPTSTNTPIPMPQKPQCKRELNLSDSSPDSVEIIDNVLGDTGCIDYLSLQQHQPSRFWIDAGLVISTNVPREQVLQAVYDINKRLFTSNLGITCVMIMVYSPANSTNGIDGVNQSLGYQLAQEFNGRWDTVSAQEWWSWLETNTTPFDQISDNCELDHWAQWDERAEIAPWK